MRVVRTEKAEEDLIEIWIDVAKEDERAADRLLDRLEQKTKLLGLNPNIGRVRAEIGDGVRSLVSGSYLILYRIETDVVEIVRYVHTRRQLAGLV